MNAWLAAALVLMLALVPLAVRCFYGDALDRLAALEAAGTIVTLMLMLLAHGFGRMAFYDISLTTALLAFGGGLVFVRFLERWL